MTCGHACVDTLTPDSFAGPRAFARWALQDERLRLRPEPGAELIRCDELAVELILFRESIWQATLIVLQPNVVGRAHRHHRVESIDVVLAGNGTADVLPAFKNYSVAPARPGQLLRSLHRVPRGAVHTARAGPKGASFLSFQQWLDEPDFLANDWENVSD